METFVAMMSKRQAVSYVIVHGRTKVEKTRFLRPDVAIVITTIEDRRGDGPVAESRANFVLSKESGRWLLNSFQNTLVTAPPGTPPERLQTASSPPPSAP